MRRSRLEICSSRRPRRTLPRRNDLAEEVHGCAIESSGLRHRAMAACVFCGQRKGKRTCPALAGSICSTCCGQHRLSKIQCPSDCAHLGGLAIVSGAPVSFTQDDYSAAVKKLLEFARVDVVDPRLGELFGSQAAEWEMPIVNAYLLYGHRAEDDAGTPCRPFPRDAWTSSLDRSRCSTTRTSGGSRRVARDRSGPSW